jgi:hypothetical protein
VRRLPFTDHVVVSKLFHPSTPRIAHIRAEASNSVPVAIGSRRIFAAPLDLACRNIADVGVVPYAALRQQRTHICLSNVMEEIGYGHRDPAVRLYNSHYSARPPPVVFWDCRFTYLISPVRGKCMPTQTGSEPQQMRSRSSGPIIRQLRSNDSRSFSISRIDHPFYRFEFTMRVAGALFYP